MGLGCWMGMDRNSVSNSARNTIEFARSIADVDLGWIDEVVPPREMGMFAAIRHSDVVMMARGDEQNGSDAPQSSPERETVDLVRIHRTTCSEITPIRDTGAQIGNCGIPFAPHPFALARSQAFGTLGDETPIAWGMPDSGVSRPASPSPTSVNRDAYVKPLPEDPQFVPLHKDGAADRRPVENGLLAELTSEKEAAR